MWTCNRQPSFCWPRKRVSEPHFRIADNTFFESVVTREQTTTKCEVSGQL